jgi:hypothetical protein
MAGGWRPNLVPALRQADGQDAKQIRRYLRPAAAQLLRLRDSTDISGQLGPAVREALARHGNAFIAVDLPVGDRESGIEAVGELRKSLPRTVAAILVTNVAYQAQSDKRASLEVLVVDTKGQG